MIKIRLPPHCLRFSSISPEFIFFHCMFYSPIFMSLQLIVGMQLVSNKLLKHNRGDFFPFKITQRPSLIQNLSQHLKPRLQLWYSSSPLRVESQLASHVSHNITPHLLICKTLQVFKERNLTKKEQVHVFSFLREAPVFGWGVLSTSKSVGSKGSQPVCNPVSP